MTSADLVVNLAKRVVPPKLPRNPPITFTDEEARHLIHPHIDALVVELDIANHIVIRNLIDTGSSVDVLFVNTLKKMTLLDKSLQKVETPLLGFTRNIVEPTGTIVLDVTFRTLPKAVTIKVNILVVECPSVYHTIIRRPTLHCIRTITSTYHLMIKFPTPNGIGELRGEQGLSRECYELATKFKTEQKVSGMIEVRTEPLKRPATQKPEGSGQE
ncbi:hypothetical protein UlMin_021455 [Ulmus minor]